MIPRDKIRQVAERLLAKTQAQEVRWKPDFDEDSGCLLELPRSRVSVVYRSPRVEPDKVTFSLLDADDFSVGDLTSEEGDEDWELLSQLYREASRVATGWDKVLDDVEQAVNAKGPIGLKDKAER